MLRLDSLLPLCGRLKLTGNRGHHPPSNRISLTVALRIGSQGDLD